MKKRLGFLAIFVIDVSFVHELELLFVDLPVEVVVDFLHKLGTQIMRSILDLGSWYSSSFKTRATSLAVKNSSSCVNSLNTRSSAFCSVAFISFSASSSSEIIPLPIVFSFWIFRCWILSRFTSLFFFCTGSFAF